MDNNYIKVQVEGKNVNNYIKWVIKQKFNIINLKVKKHNLLELIISNKDYKKLNLYSKTYNITIIKKYGRLRLLELIKQNSYNLIFLLLAILGLYIASHIIFSIDIIYNDKDLINIVEKELKKYGIEKYRFKKKYSYLNKVKEEILKNNTDILEWIEIVENGTKYTIKLVERKKEETEKGYEYQSIVATKDAIITNIKATSGEKIKEINDYVKKDEIIVSGILTRPDGTLVYQKANATICGEVWYKIQIEYPYAYYEEKLTGRNKEVFVIKFLNNKIPIFTYQKYKQFKVETDNIILENSILPISLSKEKQYEVVVTEDIYTWEEALSNAIELSKKKLLESNNKIITIKKVEVLNKETIGDKIKLNLFISVEENITKLAEVKKTDEIKQENNTNDLQS